MLSLSSATMEYFQREFQETEEYYFSGQKDIYHGTEVISGEHKDAQEIKEYVYQRLLETQEQNHVAKDKFFEDLTFSAPKSVSVAAAISDRDLAEKIINAHNSAVERVFEFIKENDMIQSRKDGAPTKIDPNSISAVRINHFESRNMDPQLHSHVLIANAVRRAEDGKLTAAYMRDIYVHKKELGAMYRQELGSQLEKLGFQIEWQKDGLFELKGFSEEQLKEFSTRRQEIEQKLEELKEKGIEPNGKISELATLDTRQAKQDVPFDLLQQNWIERAEKVGISKEYIQSLREQSNQLSRDEKIKQEMIQDWRKDASIGNTIQQKISIDGKFKEFELQLKAAYDLSKNGITSNISEIQSKVEEKLSTMEKKGEYQIKVGQDRVIRNEYSTFSTMSDFLKNEITKIRETNNAVDPEKARETIQKFQDNLEKTEGFRLSPEQEKIVHEITTSKMDSVIIGKAGAGKTTAMQMLKEVYQEQGKSIIGVSISGVAAANLEKEAGIRSYTIDSLAMKMQGEISANAIIVDEAGMLDERRTSAIKEIADMMNAKVIYVGDPDQIKPVGAGDPFLKLANDAMNKGSYFEFTEIHRQKVEEYKEAVRLAAFGNSLESLKKFENIYADKRSVSSPEDARKIEIVDRNGNVFPEREFRVGDKILFHKENKEMGIEKNMKGEILGFNDEKNTISVKIEGIGIKEIDYTKYNNFDRQAGWVYQHDTKNEKISGIVQSYVNYIKENIQKEQNRDIIALSFRNADVDRLNNEIRYRLVKDGILNNSPENSRNIEIKDRDGRIVGEKEFSIGDKVLFYRNDRETGLKNGMRGEITGFDPKETRMTVNIKGFGEKEIDYSKYQNFDYGYAMTFHKSQGLTVDKVIVNLDKNLNSNLYYVGVSRGKYEAEIHVVEKEYDQAKMNIQRDQEKGDILAERREELAKQELEKMKETHTYLNENPDKQNELLEQFREDLQFEKDWTGEQKGMIETQELIAKYTDGHGKDFAEYQSKNELAKDIGEKADRENILTNDEYVEKLAEIHAKIDSIREQYEEKIEQKEDIAKEELENIKQEIQEVKEEIVNAIQEKINESENIRPDIEKEDMPENIPSLQNIQDMENILDRMEQEKENIQQIEQIEEMKDTLEKLEKIEQEEKEIEQKETEQEEKTEQEQETEQSEEKDVETAETIADADTDADTDTSAAETETAAEAVETVETVEHEVEIEMEMD